MRESVFCMLTLCLMPSLTFASQADVPQVEEKSTPNARKTSTQPYEDNRPFATKRINARDHGVVLRHGDGPKQCDLYGARDVWCYEADGVFYMHYDAAGPTGWLCSLATSKDLIHWDKQGPVLDLGRTGEMDSASASYGITYFDGQVWHMFYLGTPNVTPPPDRVPSFPYVTMKAKSQSPAGPWKKQPEVVPFRPRPNTYYSATASPGHIVRQEGEYLQFFSASITDGKKILRTLGIARTRDLDSTWTIDPQPIVPLEEQVENSSLYYEPVNRTWFLFTNHIGIEKGIEFTDAVWVYWSKDLEKWNVQNKAVVLDGRNCTWSSKCIGLPSVLKHDRKLAILYDAPGGEGNSHMHRDVGLAWLDLPLTPPD